MLLLILLVQMGQTAVPKGETYSITEELYLTDLISVAQIGNQILMSGVRASGRSFKVELHLINLQDKTGFKVLDGRIQKNPSNTICIYQNEFVVFNPSTKRIYRVNKSGEFVDYLTMSSLETTLDSYVVVSHSVEPQNSSWVFTLHPMAQPLRDSSAFYSKLDLNKNTCNMVFNWTLDEEMLWVAPDFLSIGDKNFLINRYTSEVSLLAEDRTLKVLKKGFGPFIVGTKKIVITPEMVREIVEKNHFFPLDSLLNYPIYFEDHLYLKERDIDLVSGTQTKELTWHVLDVNTESLKINKRSDHQFPFGRYKDDVIWFDIVDGEFSFKPGS